MGTDRHRSGKAVARIVYFWRELGFRFHEGKASIVPSITVKDAPEPLKDYRRMFHDEDNDTEITFGGNAGTVTWAPGGPTPPVSNNFGPMPFDAGTGETVNFLYFMEDFGPLPRLPLKFLGTTGETVFTLEPDSEWSTTRPDQFVWSN